MRCKRLDVFFYRAKTHIGVMFNLTAMVYSMGLILLCVYGLQTLLNHKKSSSWTVITAKSLVAFTLLVFVSRTVLRNGDWQSRPTIIK